MGAFASRSNVGRYSIGGLVLAGLDGFDIVGDAGTTGNAHSVAVHPLGKAPRSIAGITNITIVIISATAGRFP